MNSLVRIEYFHSNHDLIIIEIWYGDKLDENDIKRYEDIYERI